MSEQRFNLSDIQQAYLIGRQGVYEFGDVGIHFYFEVDGRFDYDRLNQAWTTTVRRHPMMRAHVLDEEYQIIKEDFSYDIERVDLKQASAEDSQQTMLQFREDTGHHVYDPKNWPLFRLTLFEGAAFDRLVISIDAINIDLNSFILVFNTLASSYDGEALAEMPHYSFRDYVLALERQKTDPDYIACQSFWQDRLESLPPAPLLPLRKQNPKYSEQRFSRLSRKIPKTLWNAAQKKFSSEFGITPSCLLLAAYAEVLRGWSENKDFTLNVTAFNRQPFDKNVEYIEGDFTSMLFVEAKDIQGNFVDRAQSIQNEVWDCLEHRFGAGPEALRAYRASNDAVEQRALFPIVFTSAMSLDLDKGGLYGALERLGEVTYALTQTPQLSLDYQVHEVNGELFVIWDYIENLYPNGMIERMFDCYIDFLERLFENTGDIAAVSAKVLCDDDVALLEQLNDTGADYPTQTLAQAFLQRCEEAPDKIAIFSDEGDVTYGDLRQQAERIANRLQSDGINLENPVGVLIKKSVDQIAAVFGVLIAGGCYVPLDVGAPENRLKMITSDAGIKCILVADGSAPISRLPCCVVLDVSQITQTDQAQPVTHAPVNPQSLAYILYTSGSTGVPKGVAIEHRSVVNRMSNVVALYGISRGDVAFGITALHHDLSVFDLFGMLCFAGGSIALPGEADRKSPDRWSKLIDRANVSVWNSVPAFAEMLCEYTRRDAKHLLPTLRLFVLSGDFIPLDLPDRLKSLIFGLEVIGSGGPTETTVWDVTFPIEQIDDSWSAIPYGVPLRNARYYVLDDDLKQKPIWAVGEFYIGGVGLAREYWRNAALTQEKFVVHPETGERLFKSGDIGFIDNLGRLNIVGRKDFQVKIHGERIEIGEIEACLTKHPQVAQCVVMAHDRSKNRKELVAYIKRTSEDAATSGSFVIKGATNTSAAQKIDFKLQRRGTRRFDTPDTRRIDLPTAHDFLARQATMARVSHRSFGDEPISGATLGAVLSALVPFETPEQAFPKYTYPSAGGLYPVQTYVQVFHSNDPELPSGCYYFNPFERCLIERGQAAPAAPHHHTSDNATVVQDASFMVHLIAHYDAITPTYGDTARDFCLLEAGYIGQELMHEAGRNRVGLCPIGAFDKSETSQALGLGPEDEVLHSFAGGYLAPQTMPETEPAERGFFEDVTRFAATELSGAMVPERFVVVDQWPLNANGKTDRAQLKQLGDARPVETPVAEHVQADDGACTKVHSIFQSVLETDEVQINVPYKYYGANSVSLIRVHRAIEEELNIRFSVRNLLEAKTISDLMPSIHQHLKEA